MPRPQLTFFTELPSDALIRLFDSAETVDFLVRGGHHVSMAMMDFAPERAEVIRRLEAAGVPVTAWLLLGEADGYWLNADNASAAMERYVALHAFSRREKLTLPRLGLDIEPPRHQLTQLLTEGPTATRAGLRGRRERTFIEAAEATYARLVALAHRDGRRVEAYQFPQILDERRAHSHLLRRSFGLVDLDVDTEVLMLYRSYFSVADCRVYYDDAQAIALGVTGGGVYADQEHIEPKLSWEELRDDLLAASRCASALYVFSLEGCVERGMLGSFEALCWDDEPAAVDRRALRRARRDRGLRSLAARAEPLWDLFMPPRRADPPRS